MYEDILIKSHYFLAQNKTIRYFRKQVKQILFIS